MKILVNGPAESLKNKGGVANHIWGLRPYWTEEVVYNAIGNRGAKEGGGKFILLWDIVRFFFKLLFSRPDFVWINPSIGKNALRRDFIFLNIAHALKVKTAVFIHGFNLDNFEAMDKKWLRNNFNKAAFIMVLAEDFKKRLRKIGVTVPIELTTTKVEDSLLDGFDISTKDYDSNRLLFLARVEKAKGIYETIDTFALLKKEFPELVFQLSGGGTELENVKAYVKEKGIEGVEFTGFISGDEIKKSYADATMMFLISYGEGMPTNVLEAMAFGVPVVIRPVGGLADFFIDGKMGIISSSLDPKEYASMCAEVLKDRERMRQIGEGNHIYAKEHFMASRVARQLEGLFTRYN